MKKIVGFISQRLVMFVSATAMLSGCLDDEPVADEPVTDAADALESDCHGVPVPGLVMALRRRSVPIAPGVTLTLETGTIAGVERAWARLSGSTEAGDLLWIEWTTNGGASWAQCGPFQINVPGMSKTTPAVAINPLSQFRACGRRAPRPSVCTEWW